MSERDGKPSEKALTEFLSEAQEIVEALGRDLLALDEQRAQGRIDPETVNEAFRAVHSLKGLSGLFGVARMVNLSHNLENLLDGLRLGRVHLGADILDLLFEACELYQKLISETSRGRTGDDSEVEDLIARLDRVVLEHHRREEPGLGDFDLDPGVLSVLTEYEEHRLRENVRLERALYRIHAAFDLMSIDRGLEDLKKRLKPVGEVITYLPSAESGSAEQIELDLILGAAATLPDVRAVLEGTSAEATAVPRLPSSAVPASAEAGAAPTGAGTPTITAEGPSRAGASGGRAHAEGEGAAGPAGAAGLRGGAEGAAGRAAGVVGPAGARGRGDVAEQAAREPVAAPAGAGKTAPGAAVAASTGKPARAASSGAAAARTAAPSAPPGTAPATAAPPATSSAATTDAGISAATTDAGISAATTAAARAASALASARASARALSAAAAGTTAEPAGTRDDAESEARAAAAAAATATLRSVAQTVRVDIHKLDYLMNVVGELALARAGIVAVLDRIKADRTQAELARALHHEVRALDRKLHELQAGILEVRMVPLGQVFDKLSRVVRKISREAGKDIRFVITGADTELDKLIVEELSDPLMHIIRNAIDHGIESASRRAVVRKPATGTIALAAYQKGNHVVIEVEDDGQGLNERAILASATSRGLIDKALAAELGRRDIHNLIFLPGVSTKHRADEISGRGVGMDVVKTNIAKLSGIIDVQSEPGHGTKFSITLPITLAIIQALVIRAAARTYCIPLNSVLESLLIDAADVRTIERREVITLRGATLPLIRLEDVFKLPQVQRPQGPLYVVVVGLAQHRLGLVVDDLAGQQDIVIKPLGKLLGRIRGIAGATELGGQQTVLVLDVAALVEEALLRAAEAA